MVIGRKIEKSIEASQEIISIEQQEKETIEKELAIFLRREHWGPPSYTRERRPSGQNISMAIIWLLFSITGFVYDSIPACLDWESSELRCSQS